MTLLRPLLCVLVMLLGPASGAAQLAQRPLPPTAPIGIIFQSEVGRTTGSSLKNDELTQAAIAEVEQTLRQLGYEVVPRADVVQKLIELGTNCRAGVSNCAPTEVLAALDLGAVVLVAIWWTAAPADITIEVTSPDAVGIAKGKLDEDVGRRVPELVTAALADLKNGRAVEVQVHSLPAAAEVRLDGELVGTAPVNVKARPGPHEVTLSYPDYVTTSHHFEVPRGSDEPVPVHISMERVGSSAAGHAALPPPTEATPAWDYLLGGGLVVVSAILAVSPIKTLGRSGECDSGPRAGECSEVSFGARSGLLFAGSAIALGGAIYMVAATPIAAALSYDGESGHVQLSGSF